MKLEKERDAKQFGQFIQSGPEHAYRPLGTDYSVLPTYKDKRAQNKQVEKSDITLKYLYIQQNEIQDSQVFQDFKYGLNRSNLVELNLMNNKLGDVSVKYIAQAIGGVC